MPGGMMPGAAIMPPGMVARGAMPMPGGMMTPGMMMPMPGGMMMPGGAAIPAVAADRLRHAEATGARAVAMGKGDPTPEQIMTPEAFANAFRVLLAIGGSTNGLIHMTAVAGRLGIQVDLEALDRMGQETPVLVDLKPSGQHYICLLYTSPSPRD